MEVEDFGYYTRTVLCLLCQVIHGERFAQAILEQITAQEVKRINK